MSCCSSEFFIYFILSIALALMAVSTTLHQPQDSYITESNKPILHPLSLNASNTLRRYNFKAIETLLHISPEIFLTSPSQNTTLFAIHDSSLYNTSSLSPLLLKQILQYHTLPQKLTMNNLLTMPQGTCLPTLLHHKTVEISNVDQESRTLEVNHIRVSHPDMFLDDSLVIHGVLEPFSLLQCESERNKTVFEDKEEEVVSVKKIDWIRIVQVLSSKGYVPFAIGLNSVLNRIVKDQQDKNLTSGVTVLATTSLDSLSSASPLLYEVVRHHVLAQRLTYEDLASLADEARIKTMDPYQDVVITRRRGDEVNSSRVFAVSGVEILVPDMFSGSNFVIHGLSHALDVPRHKSLV